MNPISPIKKLFAFLKKKPAAPAKGGPGDIPFVHDDNVVLIFGHSNAGKTVYFSVLYELLKGNEEFKLSPLNNETAAALIESYNLMRGKVLKIKEGRQVEIEGERKFPTMTSETRILKFGLDKSLRKGLKFYTVDYKGETLAIAEPGQLRQQFAKFFPYARAALFFLDASVLDTDVLLREQIAAFQTILHDLRDCVPKKIPVGIVITKSDFLEGFSTSNPVELIPANAAIYKGRGKESFIRGLTKVNSRRFGEVWSRTTERVTRTLGNLIDSVSAYNLDFQFFFVSATGGLAKRMTGEVEPPRDIRPCGVADPLRWSFDRIMFNKTKALWRTMMKWAVALCFLWIALFSLVNLYHYISNYADLDKAEERYAKGLRDYGGAFGQTVADNLDDYYDKYLSRLSVSDFFGAAELRQFANNRKREIQSRVSTELTQQEAKQPPKKEYDEKTSAAQADYNKIVDAVGKLPPDQQKAELEAKIAELWTKHPKDGLDPEFVKQVEAALDAYKQAGSASQEQEFELVLILDKLGGKTQVTIQIGDAQEVEFTNYGEAPTVQKSVSGKGNAPVKFKWLDLSPSGSSDTPIEEIADPMKDFYPKLKSGGYTLNFGRDYGIMVKLKSGNPPAPPSVPKL